MVPMYRVRPGYSLNNWNSRFHKNNCPHWRFKMYVGIIKTCIVLSAHPATMLCWFEDTQIPKIEVSNWYFFTSCPLSKRVIRTVLSREPCQHTILQPIHTVRTSSDLAMQGRLKNNFRKTKIKNKAKLFKMSF